MSAATEMPREARTLAAAPMSNKWMRLIVIGLTALVVMAVVVRLLFWQSLPNILTGEFLR